ncbi:SpoIIE family protein phosphatase [Streptomyces fagopyri]|uniref:SpoIIE family protein phosphatase n=1 Tax=Streptomyces fagopyri TaxID=2662397 RepID=A0A5Q0LL11_9ACTN|nr:SpoIIE family protein phosphatase [Streptomyces fagopyri]QFZ77750.1 SpoIIE family protein phosphatase [Streptomyces fagopyri]
MPSGDVLVLIDEDGLIVEWRRQAEQLFGWSAEEAVGQAVTALVREFSAGGEGRREGFAATTPVLVKPVLRGTSLMWQVLTARDAVSGQDVAILEAMFAHSPARLHVLDHQLRVAHVPGATHGLSGTPVEDLAGKRFVQAYELEDPEKEAAVAQQVLDGGEPVVSRLVRAVVDAPDGLGRRIYSVSYVRLENADGDVLGLVASALDVTERENTHRRLALLEAVRAHVGQGLNVGAVCEELVEAVVPAFAGITVVEVIEDVVHGEEPPQVPVREDIVLRRAAFRGPVAAYPVGDVRPLPRGTPFARVLTDLRPRLLSIGQDTDWLTADPARADAIERSGAHSLIVAPLALRGQVLGVVSFYRHRQEDPFKEEDVAVASAVCAHTALCVETARAYMREWIIAATVQRRLLPQHAATPTTMEISRLFLPDPDGGGAWSDTIALPGARTALIVGDLAQQGIAAAVTVGILRTAVHTLAALDLEPDELLARLSDTAGRLSQACAALPPGDPMRGESLTAGCAVAIYDPIELTCTLARAGLPRPVAVLPDGTSTELPVPPGPLLADTSSAPFPATTVDLPEGSILAMGTVTAADTVLAPSGPLRPLLDSAGARPLAELCGDLAAALPDDRPTGDTLVLLARTRALPADRVLSFPLPAGAEAAPLARRAARRQLKTWGVDEEAAFTTELIVSELVGNAIRHGAPPLRLRLILDRALTCEVSDGATSAPHVKHARTVDETGRGLFIVASLADQWGARHHKHGKTVWAEQPLPSPGSP